MEEKQKNAPFDPSFQFGLKSVLSKTSPTFTKEEFAQIEKTRQSYFPGI
jgi:hypothetical protein